MTVAEGAARFINPAEFVNRCAWPNICPGPAVDWRARCLAAEALVVSWEPAALEDRDRPLWDAWLAAGGRLPEEPSR